MSGTPAYRQAFPLKPMRSPFLLDGGVSVSAVPLHLPLHAHPGYELHLIESGAMTLVLAEGATLKARGGDLILTQPGVRHQGEHDVVSASKHVWMVVDPLVPHSGLLDDEAAALARDLQSGGNAVFSASLLKGNYRQLLSMLKSFDAGHPYASSRLRHACIDLLMAAALVIRRERQGAKGEQRSFSDPTLKAIGIIRDNLANPLSVQQIASSAGLSPSRFHEIFLEETGETPAAYYLRMRCSRAAEALHAEDAGSISSIALSYGFEDQRYFATCFKRVFGVSPSAFRASARRG